MVAMPNHVREQRMRDEGLTRDPVWRNHDAYDDGRLSPDTVTITINRLDAFYLQSLLVWQRSFWQRRSMGASGEEHVTARAKLQRLARMSALVFQALKAPRQRPTIRSLHAEDTPMTQAWNKARSGG